MNQWRPNNCRTRPPCTTVENVVLLQGCRKLPDHQPTIPSVNFRPKLKPREGDDNLVNYHPQHSESVQATPRRDNMENLENTFHCATQHITPPSFCTIGSWHRLQISCPAQNRRCFMHIGLLHCLHTNWDCALHMAPRRVLSVEVQATYPGLVTSVAGTVPVACPTGMPTTTGSDCAWYGMLVSCW